jgi:glycosyltransferase involved in cell wall biosynthesis
MTRVAIFTDNDFAKVNGVTTTLKAVLRSVPSDIDARLYTMSSETIATDSYRSSRSIGVGLPRYPQMKIYWPRLGPLSRAFSGDGADVVHITTPGPVGLAARYLAHRYRRPLVGSFHTNLGDYARALGGGSTLGRVVGRGLDDYMRWLYGACDRVLVPSADTRMALIDSGYDPRILSVWSRGVDATQFSPARRSDALRRAWKADADTPVLLYVGRLSAEKGLDRLLTVSDALTAQRARFRLVLAGDGPMRQALTQRLPFAHFCGEVPHTEVGAVMASADVFVFPSDTDTFGNVVLEAQASGLPAVVSSVGGPREIVWHGASGFVCSSGDPGAFPTHVAALLRNPALRQQFAEEARRLAERRDWREALSPLYQQWRDTAARTRELTESAPRAVRAASGLS